MEKNSATRTPYDHSGRCLIAGGHTATEFNRGEMVNGGEVFSHKCSRTTGINTILTVTKDLPHLTIRVQVDNKVALAYLLKMGGTRSPQLLKISKSVWNYLPSPQIIITAEYFPSRLNVRADWQSRNATDSSDWKLHQKVYLKITKLLGNPTVDLFASRLCHQLPQYVAWKPDPKSSATDAMQQDWIKMFGFAFPPFA